MNQQLYILASRANKCTLGLTVLYGVNSFATLLMKSMPTLPYLEFPTYKSCYVSVVFDILTRWDSR
jgi:hypothetical protein